MIDNYMRKLDSDENVPLYAARGLRSDKILQVGLQKIRQAAPADASRSTGQLDPTWLVTIREEGGQGPYQAPRLQAAAQSPAAAAAPAVTARVQADIARGKADAINQCAGWLGVPPSQMAPIVQAGIRSLQPADQRWQTPLPPTFGGVLTNGSVNPVNGNLYNPPTCPIYGQLPSQSPTVQPPASSPHHGFWQDLWDVVKIVAPIAIVALLLSPLGAPILASLGGALGGLFEGGLGGLGSGGLSGLGNLFGGLGNIGNSLGGLGSIGNSLGGLGNIGNSLGGTGNIGNPLGGLGSIGNGGLPNIGDLPSVGGATGAGVGPGAGTGAVPGLGGINGGLFNGLPGLGDDLLTGGLPDLGKIMMSGARGAQLYSLLGELLSSLFHKKHHHHAGQPPQDQDPAPALPPAPVPQLPTTGQLAGNLPSGNAPGDGMPPGLGWCGQLPGTSLSDAQPIGPGWGNVPSSSTLLSGWDDAAAAPVYTIQSPTGRSDKVESLADLTIIVGTVNKANGNKSLSPEEIGQLVELLGQRGIVPQVDDGGAWVFEYPPAGQTFTGQQVVAAVKRIPGTLMDQTAPAALAIRS